MPERRRPGPWSERYGGDRFLILGGKELYHFGSSLNQLGRHYCAVVKMECFGKKLRPIKAIEGLDLSKYDVVFSGSSIKSSVKALEEFASDRMAAK